MKMKVLVYLGLALLLLSSCENDMSEMRALDAKSTKVETGTMINAYMSVGGKIRAHLTAPLMKRSTSDSNMTEFPKTLHVYLYNDSGTQVTTYIFAKYGRQVGSRNLIFLKDSVVIYNTNKDTLRTSELYWNQSTNKMYTDKVVWAHRIDPTEQYIHAKSGMVASSSNFNNYTFFDPQDDSFLQYSEAALGPGGVQ
ncbi:MAG: LPS export ABC transporter periplasmic protein LptC [Chitinophagaceae bacterium]